MRSNIEQYKVHIAKQKMLGVKDFRYSIDEENDKIIIEKYIGKGGIVTIPLFVTGVQDGVFDGVDKDLKVIYDGVQIEDMSKLFRNYKGQKLDLSDFHTKNVKNMTGMFDSCRGLKELDLSSFDTKQVERMFGMFVNCESIEKININNLDTSRVADMGCMFMSCTSLKSLDLSNFNTSKAESMFGMFFVQRS